MLIEVISKIGFLTIFADVTLTLTWWPSYMNLTRIGYSLQIYRVCENELPPQDCRKLSYYSPRMNVFSYAWSFAVTWQRWRSHHSIRHSQKAHAACKVHGSRFYRTGVIADQSFTLREWGFSTFVAAVTLTLTRWPSYMKLTRIP